MQLMPMAIAGIYNVVCPYRTTLPISLDECAMVVDGIVTQLAFSILLPQNTARVYKENSFQKVTRVLKIIR